MYSFSDPARVVSELLIIPNGFSIEPFTMAFNNNNIFNAFLVSSARAVIGSVASTFISMMVAFGLSRNGLWGRRVITFIFVITMYVSAGLIPYYLLMKELGLIGSFWIYILPGTMNVFGMIIMRNYITSIPDSITESAEIDGANQFLVFIKIILPLCVPVLAAITLFSAVGHWNAYTDTLIYNSNIRELWTLQYVLMQLVSNMGANDMLQAILAGQTQKARITAQSMRMAVTIIAVVPISLVYPFLQRYFIKGLMLGAVKE